MKKSMKSTKAVNPGTPGPELHMDEEPRDYEVDDAVRTLERGEEIKKNKKLMPHVHKKISAKMSSLADLKKMASQKAIEEQGEEM